MSLGRRSSASLLLTLPPLRELHLVVSEPRDLSAIGQLSELEYLGLMGELAAGDSGGRGNKARSQFAPDLSNLARLRQAYVELCPTTDSVRRCAPLEELWLWNREFAAVRELDLSALPELRSLHVTGFPNLRELDLTAQPRLQHLHLEAIPRLRSARFHPDAKVSSLKLGGCGPYRIDWRRMHEDLVQLELVGPLRFPITDVLGAPNLRDLRTNGIRTFPPLGFLLNLPHLTSFSAWTSPPGPKWSEEDWRIYRQINARAKRMKSKSPG
jgi:hypothetical protein